MPNKPTLKRYFIKAIIAALVVSALIGIVAILAGSFGNIEARVLLTTLAVGILSITSLANLRNLESPSLAYRRFAWISISCSMIALAFTLSLIWISLEHTPWKPTLVFMVLAFSTAHASLLLPRRIQSNLLKISVTITLVCIAFVAGFLLYLLVGGDGHLGSLFYRLLGVAAILDVLGTILCPIIARLDTHPATSVETPTGPIQPPSANNLPQ